MDRFDDTTKTLVALQWVDELANKKKAALLEQFDEPCELKETFARGIVEKTLGDRSNEFFANIDKIDSILEDMQKSKEAGMDEHLSKPVDIAALEQTLKRFRVTPLPPKINSGIAWFRR